MFKAIILTFTEVQMTLIIQPKKWQREDIHFLCKMYVQLMPLDNSLVSRGVSTASLQSQFVPYSIYSSGRKGCWEQNPHWIMAAFSLNKLLPKLCQPWKDQIKGPSLLHCCNSRSHFNFLAENLNWILTSSSPNRFPLYSRSKRR